jgi:hypothetical protein
MSKLRPTTTHALSVATGGSVFAHSTLWRWLQSVPNQVYLVSLALRLYHHCRHNFTSIYKNSRNITTNSDPLDGYTTTLENIVVPL